MLLELHVLQNVAPANLNRDDTGAPKDAIFGGYRRARVSSQAWKRAVRNAFEEQQLLAPEHLAKRTKRVIDQIKKSLVDDGKEAGLAENVALALLQGIEIKAEQKATGEPWLTQYLLYLGNAEISQLAALAGEHWDVLATAVGGADTTAAGRRAKRDARALIPESVQDATQAVLNGGRAADLALFGRMLADLPENNIDGAAQVAHAISTHAVTFEFDFYTAVDDLNPAEETGAGMMGTVEFNSATFYRYTNVDLDRLVKNLDGDRELALATVRAYAHAFLTSLPTGKQTSFAAQNPPSFAAAIVREQTRWSLANAFLNPVSTGNGRDLLQGSIEAASSYWARLTEMYGDDDVLATPLLVDSKYQDFAAAFGATSAGLKGWLGDITTALANGQELGDA